MMLKHLFVEVKITQALKKVLEISLLTSLYTLALLGLFTYTNTPSWPWLDNIISAFAAIIGALLVFRTNRAYERWWEARTLWGSLVNVSRNLAIKLKIILNPSPKEAKVYSLLITTFSEALAIHLRKSHNDNALNKLLNLKKIPKHVPSYLATQLFNHIYQSLGKDQSIDKLVIDTEFRELMVVCGGCEKINSTLMSTSYRMFVKHVMLLFILIMPLTLIQSIGIYSILVVMFSSYLILALEAIARNLEQPFGECEDHIQLSQINNNIQQSVNDILCA